MRLDTPDGHPGDLETITANIQEALSLAQEARISHAVSHLVGWDAVLKAYLGDFEAAHLHLENMRREIEQEKNKKYAQAWIYTRSQIAFLEEDWAGAISAFNEMQANRSGLDAFTWGILLISTAEAHLKRGRTEDLEEAQTLLQEAGALYTRLQAPVYLEKVEALVKASRLQTFAQAEVQRQVARELEQAGRLQSSFLPEEPPQIPGFQVAAILRPARQTTGDYYDFIPLPDGRYGIVIADVADKGIGAALFMTSSRSLLRAYAAEYAAAPEQVLLSANRRITQDTHGGLFVTLFYGVLDPHNGLLEYCNAGHNPPYLLEPGGEAASLPKTGVPLGIFPDATWQRRQVSLPPGSLLALYTDGVTETSAADETLFGEERLVSALKALPPAGLQRQASRGLQAVLDKVDEFRGASLPADDLTLVIFTRSEG